jgi:hypothetical protein
MVKIAFAMRRTRKCDQGFLSALHTPGRLGAVRSWAIAAIPSALWRGTRIEGSGNDRSGLVENVEFGVTSVSGMRNNVEPGAIGNAMAIAYPKCEARGIGLQIGP